MIIDAQKEPLPSEDPLGILLLDTNVPYLPGDIGNAETFSFPVAYKKAAGVTVQSMFDNNHWAYTKILKTSQDLIQESGVKAITGNCGYFQLFQEELARDVSVPVFLSSLLQLPLLKKLTSGPVGIITAESSRMNENFLRSLDFPFSQARIIGMENKRHFRETAIKESGFLDSEEVKRELLEVVEEQQTTSPDLSIILLECSLLSPYAKAVHEKTKLPVFDYLTLINFIHASVVKKT
ncbi:hypothetical protein [Thalassobacillus sp. C254]|uniref:hypothetical protein n=1 Tax=Thalassobacillus sp. C254 TaxID=1225341 RepID=UPI0006D09E0E|nr:hypothetical protein [Thalassobacillus sp. C254]